MDRTRDTNSFFKMHRHMEKILSLSLVFLLLYWIYFCRNLTDYSYLSKNAMKEFTLQFTGNIKLPYKLEISYTKSSVSNVKTEPMIPAKFVIHRHCIRHRFIKFSALQKIDYDCIIMQPLRQSVYELFPLSADTRRIISDIANGRPIQHVRFPFRLCYISL